MHILACGYAALGCQHCLVTFTYSLHEASSYCQLCMWIILYHVNRLAMHEESTSRRKVDDDVHDGAVPAYLLDRENTTRAKVMLFG